MVTLTADDKMLAVLNQAKELAEIRDANGKVVGFFAPITLKDAQHYANAAAHLDPAEIARRKARNEKSHTTREVFEHLLSLTHDEEGRSILQNKIDILKERDGCASQ